MYKVIIIFKLTAHGHPDLEAVHGLHGHQMHGMQMHGQSLPPGGSGSGTDGISPSPVPAVGGSRVVTGGLVIGPFPSQTGPQSSSHGL